MNQNTPKSTVNNHMINSLSEEFKPQDITESIHLDINDEMIIAAEF